MNDANIATYDVVNPEIPLDHTAARIHPLRRTATGRAHYRLNTTTNAANQSAFAANANRQVREDQGIYTPNPPPDGRHDANPKACSAAAEHARHLRKAERSLDEALNLVGLLLASLADVCDARAMQTETGLKVLEKKLNKVRNRIDNHDRHYTNLFHAYVVLKGKTDERERG